MMQTNKYSVFFERILPNLKTETENLEVRGVYGGQIGHLVLSPADFVNDDEDFGLTLEQLLEDTDNAKENVGEIIEKEISSALNNSPHIFGLLKDNLPKVSGYQSKYFRYSFDFDEPISFSIKIPANKKKFDYVDDMLEQFDVIMLGSSHISYAELSDCPEQIFVGQEFREQMRELLDVPENTYRLGQVGPAPIHPRFYVIDVANHNHTQRELYFYDDDLYILVNLKLCNCSVKKIYQDIVELSVMHLELFFTLCKQRSLLLALHQAIHQKLQQTVESYMQLGTNLFFIKFSKLAKLRMELLQIHRGSLEFELQLANYENDRKSFLSILDSNIFLDDMEKYFRGMSETEIPVVNALFKTLEYMEKSISSVDVAIRTIFAAVIGASIGIFVTLLLKI